MSKIPVTLKSRKGGPDLEDGKQGVSLGNGFCEMPFVYKDKTFTDSCYITPKGEQWCATEVDKKTRKLKKFAYCDEKKPKKSTPEKVDTKPVKKTKKIIRKKKKNQPEDDVAKKSPEASKSPTQSSEKVKRIIQHKKLTRNDVKEEFKSYIEEDDETITPSEFIMPSKLDFINWFDSTFLDYKASKGKKLEKAQKFQFFNHQKLVRDYMGYDSPFRGLLLYHGLGVGKTCASIGIAETFRSNRKIIVLLNKSLKQNYRESLLLCGAKMFRLNQHWVFHPIETVKDEEVRMLAKKIGVPKKSLDANKGVWLVDFTKEPNYDSFTEDEQSKITFQINEMIDKRYRFIHMDGLTRKKLQSMVEKREFDNSILIVDEVHNLTNAISKTKPGIRATHLNKLIMEAENLKCVFLSGTPMINEPFEVGVLFNLLRGRIYTYQVNCRQKGKEKMDLNKIARELRTHPFVESVQVKTKDNQLNITQNPRGFVNSGNGKEIVRGQENNISNEMMKEILMKFLSERNIIPSITIKYFTAFPENKDEFNLLFVGEKMKNMDLFKSRIYGLASHYRTTDKSLIPTIRKNEVIEVPMSDYQFLKYSIMRKNEISAEKNMRNKRKKKKGEGKEEDDIKSSYRAMSRIHCSFVFPDAIPRPFPKDDVEIEELKDIEDSFEDEFEEEETEEGLNEVAKKRKLEMMKKYQREKQKALHELEKQKDVLLKMDVEDQLLNYSPKYNEVLTRIQTTNGTAFVYTEYKSLEGINVLRIVLKANGYGELVVKEERDGFILNVEEGDKGKPLFAVWEGSNANSEILRKIYNNDFNDLPDNIKTKLDEMGGTNLHGEIMKILLTTKTGAEGIDLKNVRQVHIIEPYWNPVRLDQIKGRAVRVGSHIQLPEDERNVDIFVYLSSISKEQKLSDIEIENDSDGASSDQVLFSISERKRRLMNDVLKAIKEASVDCSLNLADAQIMEDPFRCVNVLPSSQLSGTDMSYLPNIYDDPKDVERQRRVKVDTWKPLFVKIRGTEYALRTIDETKQLIYDGSKTKMGRPGEPIGEILVENKKKKVVMYKKKK